MIGLKVPLAASDHTLYALTLQSNVNFYSGKLRSTDHQTPLWKNI
jgi:hypothetical protein